MTGQAVFNDQDIFIAADWGNSSGRLFLLRLKNNSFDLLDERKVIGGKDTDQHQAVFFDAIKSWQGDYSIKGAVLTGAVTSNIGWVETGYAKTPARPSDLIPLIEHRHIDQFDLYFLPGVCTAKNPIGVFDTVRSEDVQCFGWINKTGLKDGWLVLPGTHNKWIEMSGGKITSILTALTGELFEVIFTHTILARLGTLHDTPGKEFERGLEAVSANLRPALIQLLMSVRTRQIEGSLSAEIAADYLSGLLIGDDIRAALNVHDITHVHILGSERHCDLYNRAFAHFGVTTDVHSGQDCAINGLVQAARHVTR